MALTDEQLAALGLAMPPPDPTITPGPAPSVILPSSAPPVYPRSILGNKIPQGAAIPTSHEQGKQEYQELIPKIAPDPTAPLGSYDWQKQRGEQLASRAELMDFKRAHPWGDPISAHPGIGGKILH